MVSEQCCWNRAFIRSQECSLCVHFTHGNPPESTCKSDFVHSTSDLKTQNRLTAFTRSLKLIFSPSREDTCKSTFLITPARDTWKGTAKAAVDQKGSGESAQQPGLKDRNSPSSPSRPAFPRDSVWGPGRPGRLLRAGNK